MNEVNTQIGTKAVQLFGLEFIVGRRSVRTSL